MKLETAFKEIEAFANADKAREAKAYHKSQRRHLGVSNPILNDITKRWRRSLDARAKVNLAAGLWDTDVHEARVAAAKLLTQARIKPDDSEAWALITSWVPEFDSWAIADHACMAGQRRLTAHPDRIDQVEPWMSSDHMWTRRAAFVITLPWTKQNHPSSSELEVRDRVLSWAASAVHDQEWFIQKAIAWWLRELSKHDPDRVLRFMATDGHRLKRFAQKEATKYLSEPRD